MARQKFRTSRVLKKAELIIAGLKAINPKIDFGDDCNLQNMTEQIQQLRTKINNYNTALAVINSTRNQIEEMEKNLGNLSEQLLLGVALKYGKDSREYEMAGGVRKSRIRKSTDTRLKAVPEATSNENAQSA